MNRPFRPPNKSTKLKSKKNKPINGREVHIFIKYLCKHFGMKTIVVLIDFTEGAKVAFQQALSLARKQNAVLCAVNIADSNDKLVQTEKDMKAFIEQNTDNPSEVKTVFGVGALFSALPPVLIRIDPDLVIVCTHGVKGMFQHLFGAHILKLVQSIPFPTIVVQENNKVNLAEITKILMPIGPNPNFKSKVVQTDKLSKVLDAEIILYEIDREGADSKEYLDKNRAVSKAYFEENNTNFRIVLDELKVISAGFSRQTLEYANTENISLISLMANVSKHDVLFGVGDKEVFLVNPYGIPVLCCHD
jgi:nucleotide-binding universal stress UspA family protein